jgi:hypothetical protein
MRERLEWASCVRRRCQVLSSHGSQVKLGRWLSSAVCFRYLDNVVCWRCARGCTGAAWQSMAIDRDGQQSRERAMQEEPMRRWIMDLLICAIDRFQRENTRDAHDWLRDGRVLRRRRNAPA